MPKEIPVTDDIASALVEIADALKGIEYMLEKINEKMGHFENCIEERTQLKMLRVADMTKKP